MPEAIQFRIDITPKEEFVDPRELLPVLSNTLSVLQMIERRSSADHRAHSEWRISQASVNSPLRMTLSDVSEEGAQASAAAVDAYLDALTQMESDEPLSEPPQLFDVTALRATLRIVTVFAGNVAELRFSSARKSTRCTEKTLANIEQLLAAKFADPGSVEGILETASVHRKRTFNVYDPLTGDRIVCHFGPDKLEQVRAAWTGRVAVSGEVRYDKHGKPLSVLVEAIRKLPNDFLRVEDMTAIDITGGSESSGYIRRLRDE